MAVASWLVLLLVILIALAILAVVIIAPIIIVSIILISRKKKNENIETKIPETQVIQSEQNN